MRAPDRVKMRLVRALVLTGAGVSLGTLAHLHAAPVRLGAGTLVAVAGVLALSWVATARRVTWPVIALVLALGQALTHLALGSGHGTGHAHGAEAVALPALERREGRMVLLHAAAWVGLTVLFTVGERALWRSVELLVTPWPGPPRLVRARSLPAVTRSVRVSLAHRLVLGRAPPLG